MASGPKREYWLLGQFNDSDGMLTAARTLREEKAGAVDLYTPYPVHGLEEALGLGRSRVTFFAAAGGFTGICTALFLQLYFNAYDTWHGIAANIANRPPFSLPVAIPVTFELMVLLASLSIVGSLIVYFWGFPRPHHPVFEHEAFVNTASTSGFWVSVTVPEPAQVDGVKARLEALGAKNIGVIEEEELT